MSLGYKIGYHVQSESTTEYNVSTILTFGRHFNSRRISFHFDNKLVQINFKKVYAPCGETNNKKLSAKSILTFPLSEFQNRKT